MGSDTWRHFHEGPAERTLIAGPDTRILFERTPDDYDPIGLARRYLDGADIILAEGFSRAPLPKVEVYRRAVAGPPIYAEAGPAADRWKAIVTDDDGSAPPARCSASTTPCGSSSWRTSPGTALCSHGVTAPLPVEPPPTAPLSAREAALRILADVRRQPALRVPLDDAANSVLADDIVSPLDIPAWTNSAMDGYATRADDVRGACAAARSGSG